jgi:hypothetical protein
MSFYCMLPAMSETDTGRLEISSRESTLSLSKITVCNKTPVFPPLYDMCYFRSQLTRGSICYVQVCPGYKRHAMLSI